ncbi:MAG TPA: 4-(cytidine 5'-diphospho)-2-C-methyl-D-erythritol kinase, partial [Frankiaceae bacterium]|nr:4-(cytidine 5'-diphospho)-2-C-methyl-D-erythritol kinase [Frankiaceae bacterium]
SLYDDVTARSADGVSVAVHGEGAAQVPTGPDNLAARAARALARRAGVAARVRLELAKAIPVAAGMAGGSADAAGALVACDTLWSTGLDRGALAEVAAELGSDVPFALAGGTALGTGRGERLTPVLAKGQYHWVFALAEGGLSTGEVYAEHDRLTHRLRPAGPPPDDVLAALRAGDPAALGRALVNDLQPAALRLRPPLRRVLEAGRELGALGAVVSGSGPTCAFLVRSGSDSVALAASLAGMGVCRAVRRAHGPVNGARVVDAGS